MDSIFFYEPLSKGYFSVILHLIWKYIGAEKCMVKDIAQL